MTTPSSIRTAIATLAVFAGTLALTSTTALATPPEQPETVSPATAITATGATLHGVLNPGGPSEGGGYRFAYKQSETECEPEGFFQPEIPALALGKEKEAVSVGVTGLEPNKPYTFCVIASNLVAESTSGLPVTFETLALAPGIDSESVSGVNAGSATLEAQINTNNQATTYSFEYATKATGEELEGTIVTVPGGELPPAFGDQGAAANTGGALSEGTTYFYRVIAENAKSKEEGTPVEGKVQSFTTVPVAHTDAVTEVTATTASFHGHLTLNPVDSTFSFDYNVGSECVNGPATSVEDAGTGAGSRAVSSAVTGLQPSSSYSVCLVSSNAFGQEVDPTAPAVSFVTPAAAPSVDGESTSALTPFSVTLEALLNANNETTIYTLEYADEEAKLGTPAATVFKGEIGGFGDQGVAAATGNVLAANTTYFYRVTAESEQTKTEGKPVQGAVQSFTSAPALAPIVEPGSEHAGGIGSRVATFEANVNPDYQETTVVFEYATSEAELLAGKGVKVQAAAPITGENQGVSELADGLTPATTYFLRVSATNATGPTHSSPITFVTLVVPLVEETEPEASEVTQHGALIGNITVNPEFEVPAEPGEEPSYYVLYGETTAYDQALPAPTHPAAGYGLTGNHVPAVALSNLKPGSTYHYAIVAHNPNGTQTGHDHQFTTLAATPLTTPPAVGGSSAQFVNENSAVIESEVNPEGLATSYEVQYGVTTAYSSSTPLAGIAPLTSMQGTLTALTGLQPATIYHYRLVATNAAGTTPGPDETFTTTGATRTGVSTPFIVPTVTQIAITPFAFPPEEPGGGGTKTLTNKQKLTKALKACHKNKNKGKRVGCEKQARKRYGPVKKAKRR